MQPCSENDRYHHNYAYCAGNRVFWGQVGESGGGGYPNPDGKRSGAGTALLSWEKPGLRRHRPGFWKDTMVYIQDFWIGARCGAGELLACEGPACFELGFVGIPGRWFLGKSTGAKNCTNEIIYCIIYPVRLYLFCGREKKFLLDIKIKVCIMS